MANRGAMGYRGGAQTHSEPSHESNPQQTFDTPQVGASLDASQEAKHGELSSCELFQKQLRTQMEALPQLAFQEGTTPAQDIVENEQEFVVLRSIGEGGMGEVHLAEQPNLQRHVAIKQPKSEHPIQADMAALLQEARITGSLEHPNIIPVHTLGKNAEGHPVMVMKYVEGTTWQTLIHEPNHPKWEDVKGDRLTWHLKIVLQVCNALQFAHSKGILHRDIKPSNVMVGDFGEVYLLDWGVASYATSQKQGPLYAHRMNQTTSPFVAGTPVYLAPELLHDSHDPISEQTDIYLLGAALHEAITGQLLHSGEELDQLIESIRESAPFAYDPTIVPEELAAICHKATHQQPSERYASVHALQQAIEDFLQHQVSVRLHNSVHERYQELTNLLETPNQAPNHERIHQLFYECRFAWSQALEEWPENQAARQKLQQCLHEMFRYECSQKHLPAARSLFKQIEEPPKAFQEQLDALAIKLATEKELQQKVATWYYETDSEPAQRERNILYRYLVGSVVLIAVFFIVLRLAGVEALTTTFRLAFSTMLFFCYGAVLYFKRELLSNMYNRLIALPIMSLMGLFSIWRVVALQMELSLSQTMAAEAIIIAAACVYASLVIHSMARYHALIAIACTFLIALVPHKAPLIQLIGLLSGFFVVYLYGRKRRQEKERLPPPSLK